MSQRLALVRSAQLRAAMVARASSASASTVAAGASRFHLLRGCAVLSSVGLDRPSAALSSGAGKRRGISTTPALREDIKKADAEADAPTPGAEPAEADAPAQTPYEAEVAAASSGPDDPVPSYQNPRHHNNPDVQRVFHDEFGPDETPQDVPMPPFEDGSGRVQASPELHEIADAIVNMTMIEVNELCNRIGEHFGIEEDDGAMMADGGDGDEEGAGEGEAAAEVEKTVFDLKLVAFDAKAKIKVIKEVRSMAGLGLKEAKELVEGVPKTVMKDIKKEEAEELKAKLEELGATVEIA